MSKFTRRGGRRRVPASAFIPLDQGRMEGMIFLASNVCDLELPAVEWKRGRVAAVGGERI